MSHILSGDMPFYGLRRLEKSKLPADFSPNPSASLLDGLILSFLTTRGVMAIATIKILAGIDTLSDMTMQQGINLYMLKHSILRKLYTRQDQPEI